MDWLTQLLMSLGPNAANAAGAPTSFGNNNMASPPLGGDPGVAPISPPPPLTPPSPSLTLSTPTPIPPTMSDPGPSASAPPGPSFSPPGNPVPPMMSDPPPESLPPPVSPTMPGTPTPGPTPALPVPPTPPVLNPAPGTPLDLTPQTPGDGGNSDNGLGNSTGSLGQSLEPGAKKPGNSLADALRGIQAPPRPDVLKPSTPSLPQRGQINQGELFAMLNAISNPKQPMYSPMRARTLGDVLGIGRY